METLNYFIIKRLTIGKRKVKEEKQNASIQQCI